MRADEQHPDAIALELARIARKAGRLLRELQRDITEHRIKPDGTPTCGADLAAERLIIAELGDAFAGVPVVAEESCAAHGPAAFFFLVDPLDGTRDYLHGEAEYSVNIALIRGDRPIAAVLAGPGIGRIWIAGESVREGEIPDDDGGEIAWREARTRPAPDRDLIALTSRRHGDPASEECLATLPVGTRRSASSAVKFGLIASGEADLYVRCGPTMEWDTAAGDHIVTRAGGRVIGPGGATLSYGHADRGYLNGPFAAVGDAALAALVSLPPVATEARRPQVGIR